MSRKCVITGKTPMSGNSVSHALNRTRRVFKPNLSDTGVFSESLKRLVKIRVSAAGLRTIEHKGGFDAYIESKAKTKLDPSLRKYKAQIAKVKAARAA